MLFHVPDSAYAAELRFISDLQDALLSGLATTAEKPDDILNWISSLPNWRQLPPAWMSDNFARSDSYWGTRLITLFGAKQTERQEWLALTQGHRRFVELYAQTPNHRLDGQEWKSDNLELLKQVLVRFYDRDIPIPQPTADDAYAHTWLKFPDIRADFARKVSLCPYTGESLKISGLQLDHFLPKSRFPALSCEPENLVPCVGAGNRTGQKGETPPIDLAAANQAENWFHPRFRPALQKGKADRIRLEVRFPSTAIPSVHLVPTGDGTSEQIQNLEKLFHLSRDWTFGLSSRIEDWNGDIIGKWREQHRPPTREAVIEVISEIVRDKVRRRDREPDAFLDAAVLEGIASDPAQVADLVRRTQEPH